MAEGEKERPRILPARPAGFPLCRRCPYLTLERPDVCLACVRRLPAPRPARRCPVCDQTVAGDGRCANSWCGREDRWFSAVWAVAPHTAALRRTISGYKYGGGREWAEVLGRLLIGYLDHHMPWFDDYDLVAGMPEYTGAGARRGWDHMGLIVEAAARLAGRWWPLGPSPLTKVAETPAMAGLSLARRRACAEGRLRRALVVGDRSRVRGLRILVVDDVFTEGSTLREVARALTLAGALEVAGLVFTRQPWDAGRAVPSGRLAVPSSPGSAAEASGGRSGRGANGNLRAGS